MDCEVIILMSSSLLPSVYPLCTNPKWNEEVSNSKSIPIKVTLSPPVFNKANSPRMSVIWDTGTLFVSNASLCDYRTEVFIILNSGQKYTLCVTSSSGCTRGLPEGLCESGESQLRLVVETKDKSYLEAPFEKTMGITLLNSQEQHQTTTAAVENDEVTQATSTIPSLEKEMTNKSTMTNTTASTITTTTLETTLSPTTTTFKPLPTTTTTDTTVTSISINMENSSHTMKDSNLMNITKKRSDTHNSYESCMDNFSNWNETISIQVLNDTVSAKWSEMSDPEMCIISEYILEIRIHNQEEKRGFESKTEIPLSALAECKNFTYILRAIGSKNNVSVNQKGNFSIPCTLQRANSDGTTPSTGFRWPKKPPNPTPKTAANLDPGKNSGSSQCGISVLVFKHTLFHFTEDILKSFPIG
ncbi:unnamed protein product [Lepeophtheirus salmonis]|uniref:(salmon louse) hypothetical protein n=1 Tax=Lepeophtheirus salmonis TaxID=72036 RepID=A0A7R8D6F5_LEPSM|nr:unnamed protein product [Lepeophtheirus salmonis]CAF3040435.1 unnamed protein product [Lepeophtheirus salmonis]